MPMINTYRNEYGTHIHIKLFGYNLKIQFHRDFKTTNTYGIRNNTIDGKYLIFCDYDNRLLEHLTNEIKSLQEKYFLSDFYIFRASQKPNSYHAICLDKIPYKDFIRIMQDTSVDEYYKTMPITNDYRSWVLRVLRKAGSKRPMFQTIIRSRFNLREKSKAHYLFLKYHYGVKIKPPKKMDKNTQVYSILYDTLSFIPKNIKQEDAEK